MVDNASDQDVPRRMMDMLRMFLAASSEGEHCVLVLESKNGKTSTKFRSAEVAPGGPVHTPTAVPKKKNPARARRSKLRLEEFLKKKGVASLEHQKTGEQVCRKDADAGETSNSTSQLISKVSPGVNIPVQTGLNSPIPQVDGEHVVEHLAFSFKSDYGKWDIEDTLTEILPSNITYNLISRERTTPLGSEHFCTVVLQGVDCQKFSWPIMEGENLEVIREVNRIQQ